MTGPDPRDVAKVEFALQGLGYATGPVDGVIDDQLKTAVREAVREFGELLNHDKKSPDQKISVPEHYTPEFGAVLLKSLQDLKAKNMGHSLKAMRAYAHGEGYSVPILYNKTHDELTGEFRKSGLSVRLITHMSGLVYLLDEPKNNQVSTDRQLIEAMDRIAPVLMAPTPPAVAQNNATPKPAAGEVSTGARAGVSDVESDIKRAQELMNALKGLVADSGIDLGVSGPNKDGVDGRAGGKTLASVKASQKILGVEQTGVITGGFIAALETKINQLSPGVHQPVTPQEPAFDPYDPFATGTAGSSGPQTPQRGQPPALTEVQKNLVTWIAGKPPGSPLLTNELIRMLTGFGLKDLVPDGPLPPGLEKEAGLPADRNQRLQALYKEAHADGRSPGDVDKDILRGAEGMAQLSFGDEARREAFKKNIKVAVDAGQAALNGDKANLDAAATAFAGSLSESMKDFDAGFPKAGYVLRPARDNMDYKIGRNVYNFQADGLDIDKISEAYATKNANALIGGARSLLFKDENGKTYIAGVERASGLFTVMEITGDEVAKLEKIIADSNVDASDYTQTTALMEKLKGGSAVFRFAYDNYGVGQFGDYGRGFLNQVAAAQTLSGVAADIKTKAEQAAARAERPKDPSEGIESPVTGRVMQTPTPGTVGIKLATAINPEESLTQLSARSRGNDLYLVRLETMPSVGIGADGQKRLNYHDTTVRAEIDAARASLLHKVEHKQISKEDQIAEGRRIEKLGDELFKSAPYPAEELARLKRELIDPLKDKIPGGPPDTYYLRHPPEGLDNVRLQGEYPQLAKIAEHYPQFQWNIPALAQQILRDQGQQFGLTGAFNNASGAAGVNAAPAVETEKQDNKCKTCVIEFSQNADDVAGPVSEPDRIAPGPRPVAMAFRL